MDIDCILSYELPNIRCVNCNKPIAHLYEEYKNLLNMNMPAIEVYETLGLEKVCCRTEIGFAKNVNITKPDEYKILGIDGPEMIEKPKLKPLPKLEKPGKKIEVTIIKPCMPLSITVGSKTRKLNDELWVSYVNESIYLAQ